MKTLQAILLALTCFSAAASERIELFVSVTNTPVTGDTLTINGATRYWTNAHSSATILTNLADIAINNSMTNLYFNLSAYPLSDRPVAIKTATNQIRLIFPVGVVVSASEAGNWAEFSLSTNTITDTFAVRVPLTVEAETNRTNIASMLVTGLQYSTNPIVAHWSVASQFPSLTNANIFTGANSFTGGGWTGGSFSNAILFSGIVSALTNGYWTNGIADGLTVTNLSSPGAGSLSEKYGEGSAADGDFSFSSGWYAGAYGNYSTAVGAAAQATNSSSAAFGYNAKAWTQGATAIGTGANAQGTNGLALGAASGAGGMNSISIGTSSQASFSNSVAIGAVAVTDATDQIKLGSSSHLVDVDGRFTAALSTNMVFTGPSKFGVTSGPYGTLAVARRNVGTMATGPNTLDIAGSSYINLTTGGGAAFSIDGITNSSSGNLDGTVIWIENISGDSMTIANESGLSSVAGNRIRTTTGYGVTFGGSGIANLIYDSNASRWVLINPSSSGPVLGEIYAYNNTAFSNYVTTAGVYYQVTNIWNAGIGNGVTVSAANSRLTTQSDGYYKLGFDISFSGSSSATFTFVVHTNGVAASNIEVERKLGTGGDIGAAGRQGFCYLPTNAVVTLWLTSDGSAKEATIKHGALLMQKIK